MAAKTAGSFCFATGRTLRVCSGFQGRETDSLPHSLLYSFEIIEIVPGDTQAGSYKLLLGAISKVSGNTQNILAQWLAALWLGAAHIKQTRFLH